MKKLCLLLTALVAVVWISGCSTTKETVTIEQKNASGEEGVAVEQIAEPTTPETKHTVPASLDDKQDEEPDTTVTTEEKSTTAKQPTFSSGTTSRTNKSSGRISREEAKRIALERFHVAEKDISRYEIELDYDDDARRWEYEIRFNVGRTEYDVTVDGITGKVLEYEKDVD
ncbi:MAG: hypothetical protein E7527_00930 [Ruminococcaceae bacterium]|nr:hypothetical protein [Oscillospiraceae bacterium]